MSDHDAHVRVYQALTRLYPRSFRREYGADMVGLFRDQLADEPRWRVSARALLDTLLTVPACHVEAHMNRKVTPLAVLVVTGASAALAFAFLEGLVGILVAVAGSALAFASWRRERPAAAQRAAARWWQFLGAGLVLVTGVIVSTTLAGELSEVHWTLAALAFLTGFAFVGAGSIMAFFRFRRSSDLAA